jgi:hypothetical protein
METIRNYLETMFQGLPETEEIRRLKEELLANMEDKYQELKDQGNTENEAIGKVISEFGNIDELLREMDISFMQDEMPENYPLFNQYDIEEYVDRTAANSRSVALGVTLILIGVSSLVFLSTLFEGFAIMRWIPESVRDIVPILTFFVFLVPAVGMFVYSGMRMEQYKFIDEGQFMIPVAAQGYLNQKYQESKENQRIYVVIGVILCVLSPVAIFAGSIFGSNGSSYGVCVTLLIIAAAVFLFIVSGTPVEAYKKLLKIEEYSAVQKKKNKVVGAVASVVWPLVTAVFLIAGFVFGAWSSAWIIFPITGVLFGAFAAVCDAFTGKNR